MSILGEGRQRLAFVRFVGLRDALSSSPGDVAKQILPTMLCVSGCIAYINDMQSFRNGNVVYT